MTSPTEDRTTESFDRPVREWAGLERRPLLKVLGAGIPFTFASGIGAASRDAHGAGTEFDDESDARDDSEGASQPIDPVFGYPTTDAAAIPEGLEPAHEVELLNAPPGPNQPPLLYFDPAGLRVDPGDVVQFTVLSPDHTVTAFHPDVGPPRRVPAAAGPFSSPVLGPGAAWLYRFEHEGVYDLYCAPHLDLGMVMRVVVGDLTDEDVPEYATSVEGLPSREDASAGLNEMSDQNQHCEWPFLMPADVLGTDALDPTNVRDAGEVPFRAVADELGYELVREEPREREEAAAPTVEVLDHPDHGDILAGPNEMTVYIFDNDTQNAGRSVCHDDCAEAWPPLTVEDEPIAGDGVTADLATLERETGGTQVMANGWPLYFFAGDEEPGDTNGQGVNGAWWVLGPDGTPIRSESSE